MSWPEQFELLVEIAKRKFTEQGIVFSLRGLEDRLGITRGKAQHWKKGQRPSADDLAALSREFGLSAEWLLLEEGEPEQTHTIRRLAPNAPHDPACILGPDDTTPVGHVVPVFAMAAGGNGLDRWEPEPIAHVCIPLTYYKETILIVQVDGRSMEPEIKHGSFVGIDTAQRGYVAGETYGLRVPYEGLTIKRLFVDHEAGLFRLRSINPDHPEIRLPMEDRDDIIVGKAVWVFQGL